MGNLFIVYEAAIALVACLAVALLVKLLLEYLRSLIFISKTSGVQRGKLKQCVY